MPDLATAVERTAHRLAAQVAQSRARLGDDKKRFSTEVMPGMPPQDAGGFDAGLGVGFEGVQPLDGREDGFVTGDHAAHPDPARPLILD